MRSIFSLRFLLAVLALVLLAAVWMASVDNDTTVAEPDGKTTPPTQMIDLVDPIKISTNPAFDVDDDGLATATTTLTLSGDRRLLIVEGTPGEIACADLDTLNGCVVFADLLGEAVIWFSIQPYDGSGTVTLPAIDTLNNGLATLTNGWQLPFASVLDRRCGDRRFASYREFRSELGTNFESVYHLADRRLSAVVCPGIEPVPLVSAPTSAPPSTDA